MIRRGLALLAAAACACAVLTGCSQRPTTAFIVDGVVVTERQIDEATASCSRSYTLATGLVASSVADLRSEVVASKIQSLIGLDLAKRENLVFTAEERQEFVNSLANGPALTQDLLCRELMLDVAVMMLTLNQMGTQAFIAEAGQLDIVANPRYGPFDVQKMMFTGSGSLSSLDASHN